MLLKILLKPISCYRVWCNSIKRYW